MIEMTLKEALGINEFKAGAPVTVDPDTTLILVRAGSILVDAVKAYEADVICKDALIADIRNRLSEMSGKYEDLAYKYNATVDMLLALKIKGVRQ